MKLRLRLAAAASALALAGGLALASAGPASAMTYPLNHICFNPPGVSSYYCVNEVSGGVATYLNKNDENVSNNWSYRVGAYSSGATGEIINYITGLCMTEITGDQIEMEHCSTTNKAQEWTGVYLTKDDTEQWSFENVSTLNCLEGSVSSGDVITYPYAAIDPSATSCATADNANEDFNITFTDDDGTTG